MALRFFVPKFVTIEDKLAGLLTFKQLFALLGAFLLSFFTFKINPLLGFIVGLISFPLAVALTFVYVNGKPLMYIFPRFLDFFIGNRRFVWRRIEKKAYKEITVPEEIRLTEVSFPKVPKRTIEAEQTEIILEYPGLTTKEKVTISLNEPIVQQSEKITKIEHRHIVNPKNPYRLFPYLKFQRITK
jgi:hypothetical protein